jgi:hypothetical protein
MTKTAKWAIGIGAAIFLVFMAAISTGIYFAVAAKAWEKIRLIKDMRR